MRCSLTFHICLHSACLSYELRAVGRRETVRPVDVIMEWSTVTGEVLRSSRLFALVSAVTVLWPQWELTCGSSLSSLSLSLFVSRSLYLNIQQILLSWFWCFHTGSPSRDFAFIFLFFFSKTALGSTWWVDVGPGRCSSWSMIGRIINWGVASWMRGWAEELKDER